MSDQELIRLWVKGKSPRNRRFSWQAANNFRVFVEKPLAQVTLTDVQTFAAAMRTRKLAPRFYKQTLVALKSLFAFGQQTRILPAALPLYGWPVVGGKRSKRLRFKLSWGFLICLCFFFGRMTPRLWGQSISPEGSLTQKRLPLVAGIDSPSPLEHSRGAETATLNSPDQAEDSIGRDRRVKAFLDTIAAAEGTAASDGYRTQYTGTKFVSFQDHPREMRCGRRYGKKLCSDAAGRYQFLSTTWDRFAKKFGVKDFSPQNQDLMAIELIRERGALGDIEAGRLEPAVKKLAYIWPSFRRFGGSVESSMPKLEAMYQNNLGIYRQGFVVSN
ncbi:MAG: glycoside hydrolase family 24 [Oscillatoriales cyanobacterium]|nr:MAG: glycoside hydrolase family 24 [Oscillatoriales cyanobacterium]TAH21246.1 MAG: glycoside hydrolase family 24 [Oscillatoriales cyanobacterium]